MANETLRGNIIEFLYKIYPAIVLELDIISVFYQYHRDTDIRKSLAYLVDCGYVERMEMPHPVRRFEKQVFYKLTADGVQVAECIKRDDTVLPEGCR